jgi:hypothetical protein
MPLPALLLLLQAPAPKAALPSELAATWTAFQAALKADDAGALAKVSRFPIRSNEFGGNLADAAALKRKWKTLFPPATKACLLAATPERSAGARDTFEVFCDVGGYPIRFIFRKAGTAYRFAALDNVNE